MNRGTRMKFGVRVAMLSALTAVAGSAWGCVTQAGPSLTVVSWGGSYARACVKGYHERFTAETGIEIRLESYNGASPRCVPRSRPATSTGTSSTSRSPTL